MNPRRESIGSGLHSRTSFQDEASWALVAQGSPQDTHGAAGGGDPSDARVFGSFEFVVIGKQDRLVQDQGSESTQQGATQVDITDLGDVLALAFALADAPARVTGLNTSWGMALAVLKPFLWLTRQGFRVSHIS